MAKVQFNSVDKLLIQYLLVNDSVRLFELHKTKNISPFQLQDSVQRLVEIKIVNFDEANMSISLSTDHEVAILKYRHRIFNRHNSWRDVPESYLRKKGVDR